jgi:mono/diheme cytochrome c family protein
LTGQSPELEKPSSPFDNPQYFGRLSGNSTWATLAASGEPRMIAGWSTKVSSSLLAYTSAALLTLFTLSGCTLDGYPDSLAYPQRTDPLAVGRADKDAPGFDKPGVFPKEIFVGLSPEARDRLLLSPAKMNPSEAQQLNTQLIAIFGSPAHPSVEGGNDDTREVLAKLSATLKLDKETLARGSRLYREQCLHCHGVTGDGRGPTSPWVNPHPRDYRQGVFKFTSSSQPEGTRRPRKEDLVRTLREGIEGTSMPSFRTFPDEDLEALAGYVVHLSLRGETELKVMVQAIKGELDSGIDGGVNDFLSLTAGYWQEAQAKMIQPDAIPQYSMGGDEYKASVVRGWKLFTQQGGAGCIGCHTDYGRQSAYKFDYWGTIVRPVDLTMGTFRGGHRPIDLFWRIHSGINGTGMTAFGQALSSKDIWDLVNFVQVMPYQRMREDCGVRLETSQDK